MIGRMPEIVKNRGSNLNCLLKFITEEGDADSEAT